MNSLLMLPAALGAMLLAGPAYATGCDLIAAAQLKAKGLPVHAMRVMTKRGETTMNEYIAVDGKIYTRRKEGGWKFTPLKEPDHPWNWAERDCTADGTATVKGETADIIHYRNTAPAMDMRFWISRTSGLTLRSEMTADGVIAIDVLDFSNIQAPADAVRAPGQ